MLTKKHKSQVTSGLRATTSIPHIKNQTNYLLCTKLADIAKRVTTYSCNQQWQSFDTDMPSRLMQKRTSHVWPAMPHSQSGTQQQHNLSSKRSLSAELLMWRWRLQSSWWACVDFPSARTHFIHFSFFTDMCCRCPSPGYGRHLRRVIVMPNREP